ncbi:MULTISPECIES: hypothetical protein [unclassified Variovorax]|uniref:hypothetical protein n=1 Tax=unclassified Variovorax TaxID=663243 RepID=UPI003F4520F7
MEQFNTTASAPELKIETGVAATRNRLVISCSKIEDRFAGFARLCIFNADKPVKWNYFDLPLTIRAGALHHPSPSEAASFVFASENGDVVHLPIGKAPEMERVVGSGLWDDDSEGWGYLNALRQIGGHLYACGGGGQIYQRLGEDAWEHVDHGLLQEPEGEHNLFLNVIDGTDERALYAAGWNSDTNGGLLFFRMDGAWKPIAVDTAELTGLCIESSDSIWICGHNGVLLHGNQSTGFADVSQLDDSRNYSDVKIYGGRVYLATPEGLFAHENGIIEPVVTGLVPEYRDGHVLQVVDGVLWSIGYADIARYDGTVWERIPFPGNPPIL